MYKSIIAVFGLGCLLLITEAHAATVKQPFFRKDYVYNEETQSFYKVHTIMRSWDDARHRCILEGSKLFVPEDRKEAKISVEIMKEKGVNYAFVGVHDRLSEGDFMTIEGSSIEEVYNEFENGEPNDAGSNEDCLIIVKNTGKLNDVSCDRKHNFICKKSRLSLDWNNECDSPYKEYKFDSKLQKCYKFHLTPSNWSEAFAVCKSEESFLAVINSQEEANHLVKLVEETNKDVPGDYLRGAIHLGFHNQFGDGFTTIFGVALQSSGYHVWGNGQPDNVNNNEKCGSMFYSGRYNDINCSTKAFFICEHDVDSWTSILDDRFGNDTQS